MFLRPSGAYYWHCYYTDWNPAVFAAAFCHWFDHTGKCRIHDCITGRYDTGRTVSFSEHCTGCQCHAPWQKKVLVHEMACVETLARVNVLCVDKTGTITENKMSVQEIIPLAKEEEETSLHALIGDVVANLDADNITMQALKDYFDGKSERKAQKSFRFLHSANIPVYVLKKDYI